MAEITVTTAAAEEAAEAAAETAAEAAAEAKVVVAQEEEEAGAAAEAGLVCRLSARRDAVCSLRCPICRQEGESAHSADGAAQSAN